MTILKEFLDIDELAYSVECEGTTEEEAVMKARKELLVSGDELEVVDITDEKGSDGNVHIRAIIRNPELYKARRIILELLRLMGIPAYVESEITPDGISLHIRSDEFQGLLIGKRGQSLDALHFTINRLFTGESEEHIPIVVDVANYRKRRNRGLARLARNMGKVVRETRVPQLLDPLGPSERKIIHIALKDTPMVKAESIGTGVHKRMRIILRDSVRDIYE
jgi:spoIIIJ-associated protein